MTLSTIGHEMGVKSIHIETICAVTTAGVMIHWKN